MLRHGAARLRRPPGGFQAAESTRARPPRSITLAAAGGPLRGRPVLCWRTLRASRGLNTPARG